MTNEALYLYTGEKIKIKKEMCHFGLIVSIAIHRQNGSKNMRKYNEFFKKVFKHTNNIYN